MRACAEHCAQSISEETAADRPGLPRATQRGEKSMTNQVTYYSNSEDCVSILTCVLTDYTTCNNLFKCLTTLVFCSPACTVVSVSIHSSQWNGACTVLTVYLMGGRCCEQHDNTWLLQT